MPFITTARVVITAIIAVLVGASVAMVGNSESQVIMWVEPLQGIATINDTFVVTINVASEIPVNVFKGELNFNPEYIQVEKIDYNTSIADLWAEEPWYSNGAGTLFFIGGTTRPGGFVGEGSLVTVTFKTIKLGDAVLSLQDSEILKHDGLGTEAELGMPIDSVFTIQSKQNQTENTYIQTAQENKLSILEKEPDTDLNGDGKQNFVDVSIFMSHMASKNLRSDFNTDGKVNLQDLSILTR